ncbi:MAG: hypothetical protein ACE5NA_07800 [Nitrospiraceae bacterium]
MMREVLLFAVILTLSVFGMSCTGQPAGPWKTKIVDAETGKPLEGVVVLAYWIQYQASLGGWAGGKYYDSEEVVTGPDGRFVIEARSTFTLLPWKKIGGEFVIFKPGYGRWRIRDWEKMPPEWKELSAAEILAKDGIVIELVPLKTRGERLRFYDSRSWAGMSLVPPDQTKRLDEAVNKERAYLGFRN